MQRVCVLSTAACIRTLRIHMISTWRRYTSKRTEIANTFVIEIYMRNSSETVNNILRPVHTSINVEFKKKKRTKTSSLIIIRDNAVIL